MLKYCKTNFKGSLGIAKDRGEDDCPEVAVAFNEYTQDRIVAALNAVQNLTNDEIVTLRDVDRLRDLAISALAVVRDLDAGYSFRELHVDIGALHEEAEYLGLDVNWDDSK